MIAARMSHSFMGTVFKNRMNLLLRFTASPYFEQKRQRGEQQTEDRKNPEQILIDEEVSADIAVVEDYGQNEHDGVDGDRKQGGQKPFVLSSVGLLQKVDSRLQGENRVKRHDEGERINKNKVDSAERVDPREVLGDFAERKFLIDRRLLKYAVEDRKKEKNRRSARKIGQKSFPRQPLFIIDFPEKGKKNRGI